MKETLNVARSPSRMDETSVLLKDHVYAASSRETMRTKRIKIEEFARCFVEAGSSPYPLQEATIWQVSAALKAAKFRSAHTYLYELRLVTSKRSTTFLCGWTGCFPTASGRCCGGLVHQTEPRLCRRRSCAARPALSLSRRCFVLATPF
eukprot:201473-Amphidinium_carterae.1